jgi:hypothetical protein
MTVEISMSDFVFWCAEKKVDCNNDQSRFDYIENVLLEQHHEINHLTKTLQKIANCPVKNGESIKTALWAKQALKNCGKQK